LDVRRPSIIEGRRRLQAQYAVSGMSGKCTFQMQNCTFHGRWPRPANTTGAPMAGTGMAPGSHSQADVAAVD